MSLLKKPVFWAGVLAVTAVGWVATAPEAKSTATEKPKVVRKAVAKKGKVVFKKEDFEAKFETLNITLKDSFQPLVIRTTGALGRGDGQANAVPTDFATGEVGWVYTGNAEVDGVPIALLENRKTGEGVFLKSGERWKSAAVAQIMSDSVVMRGPSGLRTLALVTDDPRPLPGTIAPLRVEVPAELRGAIGANEGLVGGGTGGGGRDRGRANASPDGSRTRRSISPVDGAQMGGFAPAVERLR